MRERLLYIDAIKIFAIFLVVIGHVAQHYLGESNIITRFIFSFHIPLFMFISGYLNASISNWSKVGQRFKMLMIPFVTYAILIYFVKNKKYDLLGFINYQTKICMYPDNGLWFLWALFFIIVLYVLCRQLSSRMNINEKVCFFVMALSLNVVILITRWKVFGVHWIAWYFMYFSLGASYKNIHPHVAFFFGNNRTLYFILFMVFMFSGANFRLHNEAPLFYSYLNMGSRFPVVYRLLTGIIGSIVLFELFFYIFSNRKHRSCIISKMGGGVL